jgi:hypothetical protein
MQTYPVTCSATPGAFEASGAQGHFVQVQSASGNLKLKDHFGNVTAASAGWVGKIRAFENLYVASDVPNDIVVLNVGTADEWAYMALVAFLNAIVKGQFQGESHPHALSDVWPFMIGAWLDTSGGHGTGTTKDLQTKDGVGLCINQYKTRSIFSIFAAGVPASGAIVTDLGALLGVLITNGGMPWTGGNLLLTDGGLPYRVVKVFNEDGSPAANPITTPGYYKVDVSAIQALLFLGQGAWAGEAVVTGILSPFPSSIPLH